MVWLFSSSSQPEPNMTDISKARPAHKYKAFRGIGGDTKTGKARLVFEKGNGSHEVVELPISAMSDLLIGALEALRRLPPEHLPDSVDKSQLIEAQLKAREVEELTSGYAPETGAIFVSFRVSANFAQTFLLPPGGASELKKKLEQAELAASQHAGSPH